jgi:SAM-dependent methyltransferase
MGQLADSGFDTWGLEPSASFRDRAIQRGIAADRLRLGAIEDAEYETASFDLVSFGAVLEHLHNPADAIARALGWLSPNGLLLAGVPSARWLIGRLLNLSYRVRGMDYVTNLSPMHDPYHLYEFTLQSFERHGERAGYQVAHSECLPCETFLPGVLAPLAQRVMEATGTGMQLQVWLRRQ